MELSTTEWQGGLWGRLKTGRSAFTKELNPACPWRGRTDSILLFKTGFWTSFLFAPARRPQSLFLQRPCCFSETTIKPPLRWRFFRVVRHRHQNCLSAAFFHTRVAYLQLYFRLLNSIILRVHRQKLSTNRLSVSKTKNCFYVFHGKYHARVKLHRVRQKSRAQLWWIKPSRQPMFTKSGWCGCLQTHRSSNPQQCSGQAHPDEYSFVKAVKLFAYHTLYKFFLCKSVQLLAKWPVKALNFLILYLHIVQFVYQIKQLFLTHTSGPLGTFYAQISFL